MGGRAETMPAGRTGKTQATGMEKRWSYIPHRQRKDPIPVVKLERKKVVVRPIRLTGRFPTSEQLEEAAASAIDALAEANQFVSLDRIQSLLLQMFQVHCLRDLNLKHIRQIQCCNDHARNIERVNAHIMAFTNMNAMCTLYDLYNEMRDWGPDGGDFETLKLGPLQTFPEVVKCFKFPTDEEIYPLSVADLLDGFCAYLDEHEKWQENISIGPFLKFMEGYFRVPSAVSLGIYITSLPLIKTEIKKAQGYLRSFKKEIHKKFKAEVEQELAASFQKFKAGFLQPAADGSLEIRSHYLSLSPEDAVQEIFQKLQLLYSLEQPKADRERTRLKQWRCTVQKFLDLLETDHLCRLMMHMAMCISHSALTEKAAEMLAKRQEPSEAVPQKAPPPKEEVIEKLLACLDCCLSKGQVSLNHLSRLEEKLLEDFDFASFQDMGLDRFLHVLTSDSRIKLLLEKYGGMVLGGTSGDHNGSATFQPTLTEVLDFILQCRKAGISQAADTEGALCSQFEVKDIKQLGHGNMASLVKSAEQPGKHSTSKVVYEAAVCSRKGAGCLGERRVGLLGHLDQNGALLCLNCCPLLEDLAEFSHWNVVFAPQHGDLKTFLMKYGGSQVISLEGGRKTITIDIIAIETQPGKLQRLVSKTSPEQFEWALEQCDVVGTCGHLASLVVVNKGVENSPLALLANHVKSLLVRLHAPSCRDATPGSPRTDRRDPAVQFVLDCLVCLPLRLASAVANQMFLDTLGQVVGSTKSKSLLWGACTQAVQHQRLERLGCLLGVAEWTAPLLAKCQPQPGMVTVVSLPRDLEEKLFQEESESDNRMDHAVNSFLSDENAKTEKDQEREDAAAVASEVNHDAEDTATELMVKAPHDENMGTQETNEQKNAAVKEDGEDREGEKEGGDAEEEEEEDLHYMLIEKIRREEFGIGVELNEEGQRLMDIQQQRLGRSLDRLSRDLYSKDIHFVLELIQNADDNEYPKELLEGGGAACPCVEFTIDHDAIIVRNNESGFQECNIRALCDVGNSTKGKHKSGYIGQKGIGFKSVFRVTDRPEIHSNGYHFCFDLENRPMGYILPHWLEEAEDSERTEDEQWMTQIRLPLKPDMREQIHLLAARFDDIHPSLLLFLHRLHKIHIINKVENTDTTMWRRDLGEGVVEISHGKLVDRWLVVRKMLDASKISKQAKSGADVESTEIALAFPLPSPCSKVSPQSLPPKQPVFAFLPLRSYGFRFIVQGDFDVPSSREDVDRDSSWNQWLRNEIHTLFVEALEVFKNHSSFTKMEALVTFLQFVPMEDEILDFFRPVASHILQQLQAHDCLPVITPRKAVQWKQPAKTVMCRDPLVREVVSPELLQHTLGLHYLHPEVSTRLPRELAHSLGIECLTLQHLLQVGTALSQNFAASGDGPTSEQVLLIAKWLACVYRAMDADIGLQSDDVYQQLRELRILPVTSGQLIALSEHTVFLPPQEESSSAKKTPRKDLLASLQHDMVHLELVGTPDSEINSQVTKLLQRAGVKQLTPRDIVHHHILPKFRSDRKKKSPDLLVSYVIYLKEQVELAPGLVTMEELQTVVRLSTNQGFCCPRNTAIHFTPTYGSPLDLQLALPSYPWVLLDPVYMPASSQLEAQRWRIFLSNLGVTDIPVVRAETVHLTAESLATSPWAAFKDIWPVAEDGYVISNWHCQEFSQLVEEVLKEKGGDYDPQFARMYEILQKHWDKHYSRFITTQVKDTSGRILADTETSFSIALRTLPWVPAKELSVKEGELQPTETDVAMQPSLLYTRNPKTQSLLAHTVCYSAMPPSANSSFDQFLGIKTSVDVETVKKVLLDWAKRDEATPGVPKTCMTSLQHMKNMYRFLVEGLSGCESQDLFHKNPVIFLPQTPAQELNPSSVVRGKLLGRSEVWLNDTTQLFIQYQDMLMEYHSSLALKHVICSYYDDMIHIFQMIARVQDKPSLPEFSELLILFAQVQSPKTPGVLGDLLRMYALHSNEFLRSGMPPASAEALLQKQHVSQSKAMLSKSKVLITKKGTWVGLNDHPLIADDRELEAMFADKEGVNFVQTEEVYAAAGQGRVARGKRETKELMEAVVAFMTEMGVKPLSSVVTMQDVTEMSSPCPAFQQYLHRVVPLVQRFLNKELPDIYNAHMNMGMAARLAAVRVMQVKKLDVLYRIPWIESPVVRPQNCILKDDKFLFLESVVDSPSKVNPDLAKFFAGGNAQAAKDLKVFLVDLLSAIPDLELTSVDLELTSVVERFMTGESIQPLPPDDEVWDVSKPIIMDSSPLPPPPPEPPTPEPAQAAEAVAAEGARKKAVGPPCGTWPPNRPDGAAFRSGPTLEGALAPSRMRDYEQETRALPSNIHMELDPQEAAVALKPEMAAMAPEPQMAASATGPMLRDYSCAAGIDDPVWTVTATDDMYQELSSGKDLQAIESVALQSSEQKNREAIGRWGEQLVYNYLLRKQQEDPSLIEVEWVNQAAESGKPYDLVLHYRKPGKKEEVCHFVEVKSTASSDKTVFHISSNELKYALRKREGYFIYRVFNAGKPDQVRLVRVDNVSQRLTENTIHIYMLI